ncbi:MAG TPA: DUF502 domain-containing protein [Bauldia sp.]
MEPTDEPKDDAGGPNLGEILLPPEPMRARSRTMARLRGYFLTGIVIAAPLFLTITITWWFVQWIDNLVDPFIPPFYRPDSYLRFSIPGFGLVVALVFITLLGFLTRNYVGRRMVQLGEDLLGRMPIVRGLYRGLKQMFETVIATRANAFKTVGLIEYPRKGTWAIVFLAGDTRGEIEHRVNDTISVFLPTTPNPTSGFLLFVKRNEVTILDMTLEEAAKLVISAGLLTPEYSPATAKRRPRPVSDVNLPGAA